MKVYTSPATGTTYEVTATPQQRAAYREFMKPETRYVQHYVQYDIHLAGRRVQFCFDEAEVPAAVARFENPMPDISSGWD